MQAVAELTKTAEIVRSPCNNYVSLQVSCSDAVLYDCSFVSVPGWLTSVLQCYDTVGYGSSDS